MFRQWFLVFFGESRADHHVQEHLHESPKVMTLPLVLLAAGAILAGYIGMPALFGFPNLFAEWLEPVFGAAHEAEGAAAAEGGLMLVSIAVAAGGILLAYLMYYRRTFSPDRFAALAGGLFYRLFNNKYYVDEIYQKVFVGGTLGLAAIGAWIDQHIIDGIVDGTASTTAFVSWLNGLFDAYVIDGMVNAVADTTFWAGGKFRKVQTGSINGYLYVVLGAIVVAIIIKLRYAG
jgi:NADH-quinone oxidoreductase subunit L